MADCSACNGKGFFPGTLADCYVCGGSGQVDDDDDIRFDCLQKAIENTGYRESGAEMADTMEGRKLPWVVDHEYRRLCRQRGVPAK